MVLGKDSGLLGMYTVDESWWPRVGGVHPFMLEVSFARVWAAVTRIAQKCYHTGTASDSVEPIRTTAVILVAKAWTSARFKTWVGGDTHNAHGDWIPRPAWWLDEDGDEGEGRLYPSKREAHE